MPPSQQVRIAVLARCIVCNGIKARNRARFVAEAACRISFRKRTQQTKKTSPSNQFSAHPVVVVAALFCCFNSHVLSVLLSLSLSPPKLQKKHATNRPPHTNNYTNNNDTMVKHNNVVPNIHCKKKWLQSSRGPLKVRTALNQAGRKKSRRLARDARRAAVAPAPLERLRPAVHCPTQKYSQKVRLGRGFTLAELKAVKLHPSYAQTIGIAIDWRRRNHSEDVMANNIARLTDYQESLVILAAPKKTKDGAATAPATELPEKTQVSGVLQPIAGLAKKKDVVPPAIAMMAVADALKQPGGGGSAYTTMRVARKETRVAGNRVAVANRKSKE